MTSNASLAKLERRIGIDPIIAGIIAFFVAHMLIRLFGTTDFSVDDTESAVRTQIFQLRYNPNNPPLFDWLFFGLSHVFGVNLVTMQVLKTVLLTAGGLCVFLAARPGFRHRLALAAGFAGYGLTAFYGWDVFQQFSHTIALIFSLGFTLWAMMRVVRIGQSSDYVLLGLGLGLGLLSKYLFALYFLALVFAALRSPTYRPAILSWRVGLTLIVAAIVVSPLVVGEWVEFSQLLSRLGGRVSGSDSGQDLQSIGFMLALSAEFWLPLVIFVWISLYRWPAGEASAGASATAAPTAPVDDSFYPFLRDATLFLIAAMLVSVALGTRITEGRYLIAVLSLLPLTIFAAIDHREAFPAEAMENFLRGAVIIIIAVAVVRFLTFLFVSPPFCLPRCVLFVDYRPVAAQIAGTDDKQTVILTNHVHIGANLLRLVPNAKVIINHYTGASDLKIAPPAERNCLLVWFKRYGNFDELTAAAALERAIGRPVLDSDLAAIGPTESVTVPWQTKLPWDWGPKLMWAWPVDTTLGIAKIDSASSLCDGAKTTKLSMLSANALAGTPASD